MVPKKQRKVDQYMVKYKKYHKKEMSIFEAGGTRGLVLEGAYKALLAIPPTSVRNGTCRFVTIFSFRFVSIA